MELHLEELDNDPAIKEKLQNFHNSVEKIKVIIDKALEVDVEKLSTKEKIDYDLFMMYGLNTLYWMYLRAIGEDPNKNEVKHQLGRVKEYMNKAKQAHERHTIRPKVDQEAAKRFVKHGIRYQKPETSQEPPNKKIRFDN